MQKNYHLLFVDDDYNNQQLIKYILEDNGFQVTVMYNGWDALNALRKKPGIFDLIITDFEMPEMDGKELREKIHQLNVTTPVVLCSGRSNITYHESRKWGFMDFLVKPYSPENLIEFARRNLPYHRNSSSSDC